MKNNILVTTTNNFEGLKVKQYLKPLSAHVVTGTSFFSDLFASFSDFFGGRSKTYQRQLSSIYTETIEIIKQSAVEIGANAIIGLKVDIDEISGQGKSMFMITATGTAVIIENSDSVPKTQTTEKLSIISTKKMEEFRERKKIIQLAKENKLQKNDGYNLVFIDEMDQIWEFITANSVYEIANEIFNISTDATYPQLLSYLSSLDTEFTTELLFENLMSDKINSDVQYVLRLMKDLRIFDAERIIYYLQSDNKLYKNRALQLVVNDKQIYNNEDIAIFEKIIDTIKSSFQEVVSYSTKKGLLSKEKEIWICQCGDKNNNEKKYCNSCERDKYGFVRNKINPPKAIKVLEEKIEILKENLV